MLAVLLGAKADMAAVLTADFIAQTSEFFANSSPEISRGNLTPQ